MPTPGLAMRELSLEVVQSQALDYSKPVVFLVNWVRSSRLPPTGDSSMPAKVTRTPGKSMFVKEVLNNNPTANAAVVNEAWKAEGMSGSISATLISNIRSRMGLAGNLRGRPRGNAKKAGTGRGRGFMRAEDGENGTAPVKRRGRTSELMDLEVEFDRLLMKVAAFGALPEVENALRKARRQLYAGLVARA
jgi:hypothetical protein